MGGAVKSGILKGGEGVKYVLANIFTFGEEVGGGLSTIAGDQVICRSAA